MLFYEARELWRSLKTVHLYILWLLTLNAYHILWGGRGEEWKHSKLSEKPFFSSWESRAHWKVFEWFYDFCTLHIVARCADQPSPQAKPSHAHNEQTTDPCGIPEVRPRLQTSGPTTPKCLMCQPPPLILLTTPMSHPQRILKESTKISGDFWQ